MTQIESIIDVTSVSRPKVESVDPVKDISAEIMMLENGLKSKSQIITEMGYDVAQTFKQIESEKHMLNTCVVSEGETEKEKSPDTQNE